MLVIDKEIIRRFAFKLNDRGTASRGYRHPFHGPASVAIKHRARAGGGIKQAYIALHITGDKAFTAMLGLDGGNGHAFFHLQGSYIGHIGLVILAASHKPLGNITLLITDQKRKATQQKFKRGNLVTLWHHLL